ARGPDRQAVPPRRRARLHVPAGLPGLRLRLDAPAAGDPAPCNSSERGGGRGQPALGLGPPARSGQGLMASLSASTAPLRAPARRTQPPAAAPRTRSRTRSRHRHVSSGIVWIAVFGILLAGIVAVNVAVLQSN